MSAEHLYFAWMRQCNCGADRLEIAGRVEHQITQTLHAYQWLRLDDDERRDVYEMATIDFDVAYIKGRLYFFGNFGELLSGAKGLITPHSETCRSDRVEPYPSLEARRAASD